MVATLVCVGVGLSGCVVDDLFSKAQTVFVAAPPERVALVDPASLSGPNSMPWQLMPASSASESKGEQTLVVDKPGVGRVRGTQKALAQLDEKIVPYAPAGRVVEVCKDAFDPQAKDAGAYAVEAAASGPLKKSIKGQQQEVFFRIFYADARDAGIEVRQAAISCSIGRDGKLLAAKPI